MLRWFMSLFAWDTVIYQDSFEVEYNPITGKFRHRGIGRISGQQFTGPWIPGMPTEVPPAVDLDELIAELRDVELSGVLGPDCVQQSGLSSRSGLD